MSSPKSRAQSSSVLVPPDYNTGTGTGTGTMKGSDFWEEEPAETSQAIHQPELLLLQLPKEIQC
ncbi:unnamed protein product [Prunus armeniaca]